VPSNPGREPPAGAACDAVLAWVRGQPLAPGEARTFPVPPELAAAAGGHTELRAIRGADGAWFALLKTPTGWKRNFEGVLCLDRDAPADAVVRGAGPTYLSIHSHPELEELYLRGQEGPRRFAVFFDLE
jgi:hypothetical protein